MGDVTQILDEMETDPTQATDELLPLVYEELRLLAAQKLSHESPGQTLQATAPVHEAYIRLMGERNQNWGGRLHFFRVAAEAMRRILIDNARRKKSDKRGGNQQRLEPQDPAGSIRQMCSPEELIALDDALAKLARIDPAKADLVRLRYFAGLTVEQAAEVLKVSATTAKLHWVYARAWLLREIG